MKWNSETVRRKANKLVEQELAIDLKLQILSNYFVFEEDIDKDDIKFEFDPEASIMMTYDVDEHIDSILERNILFMTLETAMELMEAKGYIEIDDFEEKY
jgi:hypothetical protein